MEEKNKKSIFEIIVIILNIISIVFMIFIISKLSITRTILYYSAILIIYIIILIIFLLFKKLILDCQDKIEKTKKIKKLNKIMVLTYLIISIILIIIISLVYIESLYEFIKENGLEEMSLPSDEEIIIQFNGKFDIYEGTRMGTQIKQLIKTVSSSNMSNPEQQVRLVLDKDNTAFWTETIEEIDGIKIYEYKETNAIVNNKKYEVSTSIGKDGVIETITVTEKSN